LDTRAVAENTNDLLHPIRIDDYDDYNSQDEDQVN